MELTSGDLKYGDKLNNDSDSLSSIQDRNLFPVSVSSSTEDNSKPDYRNHRYFRYHRGPSPPSNNVRHSHSGIYEQASYDRIASSDIRRNYLQRNINRAREFIDSDDDSYAGDRTPSRLHKKEVNESVYLDQLSLTICMMAFMLYWIFCYMLEGSNQPRVVTQ